MRLLTTITALLLGVGLTCPGLVSGQTDNISEGRDAISRGEYARAVGLLSDSTGQPRPSDSADAHVYLGIAFAHIREWRRAEDPFKLGVERFPEDPRFHNELAGVYLAASDLDRGRASLRQALVVDPGNKYATDLLATVDMSMGNVQSALGLWNREGQPIVGDVLQNSHTEFEHWLVPQATTFDSGETLTWGSWRTTEARLWKSRVYSNVAVEIEPTPEPNEYTTIIRTTEKTNQRRDLIINMFAGTVFQQTPSVNWWNIRNSGVSLNSSYRFTTNRHRGELGLYAAIPIPGILFLDTRWTYRSERWNVEPSVRTLSGRERFTLKTTGLRAMLRHVPHYRVELGAGFEYRNRKDENAGAATVDRRDTGKILMEASVIPFDGRYQSRINVTGFLARPAILGDMRYSGGTAELQNRYVIERDSAAYFDWAIKGGSSRGELPIDDYFMLGQKDRPEHLLRGHNAITPDGNYGNGPLGTDFVLFNATLEERIRRLPLFNALNIPYVDLKWQLFMDAGQTFDRARVFRQDRLLVDVGGGFKLETPDRILHLSYGRSLRDGTGTFAAYLQQRW